MSHSASIAKGEPGDRPARTGLLGLGEERPAPAPPCALGSCAQPEIAPVDIYCTEHERLIPFSLANHGRLRWIAVNLLRAAVCGAVVLAALTESAIPLVVLFVLAGLAVGAAPLYRFPMTLRVVIVSWLLACVIAVVLRRLDSVEPVIRTVLAGLVLVLAVAHAGAFAWSEQRGRGAASAVTVAAFAAVPAMGFGWVLSSADFVSVPGWLRNWLLIGMLTGAAGGVLVAAIAGAVSGQFRVRTDVKRLLTLPDSAREVDWKVRALSKSRSTAIDRAVKEFAWRARRAMIATARGVMNLLLRAAYIVQVVVFRLINWGHRRLVMGVRRVLAALRATGEVLVDAVRLGRVVAGRTIRVVILPAVALAIGAAAVLVDADFTLRYLLDEGLGVLAPLAGTALAGLVALTVLWMALSGLRPSVSVASWLRTTTIVAPQVIVMFTLGGWIVGLPGTLGHGPIRLGPVTITSTLLLIAIFAWAKWTDANDETPQDEAPSSGPAPAPVGEPSSGGR